MSVLVTGGTGWIGGHLLDKLEHPILISRSLTRATRNTGLPAEQVVECDLVQHTIDPSRLAGVTAVVNLMGDSIADGRWNDAKKKSIRDSRILGTQNLIRSLLHLDTLPKVCVSASAIGYYGERGDDVIDESSGPGTDFLSKVCVDWEEAARPLINAGVRVCFLRIGIVIGKGGGAMQKILPPFRLGAGGRLGSGRQWMSWIHLEDLVNMISFLLDHGSLHGPLNGTAPNPVRNRDFTRVLGTALGRPTVLPVPKFALRTALGEFANYLCASQRVVPAAIESAGFGFRFPNIEDAITQVIG